MLMNPGHDWTEKEKNAVRRETQKLVRDGIIGKRPCAVCKAQKVEAHHPDYRFPKCVVWLCRSCHRQVHGASRPAGEGKTQRRARLIRKAGAPTVGDRDLLELQALVREYEDPA